MRIVLCLGLAAFAAPHTLRSQVTSVEVTPAHATVQAGGRQQFRAVARDARGTAVTVPVVWLATPFDIAGADSTGLVTTTRAGRTFVVAVAGGIPGIAVLDIAERGAATLRVAADGGAAATVVGGAVQLAAAAATELGDPVAVPDVQWRSLAPQIAAVDPAGLVRGRTAGTATIEATRGPLTTRLDVTVRPNPVRGLRLTAPAAAVRTGDVARLTLDLLDGSGRALPAGAAPVRWSVSGAGAAIEPDGAFVADRPGAYAVTATVGDRSAVATVRVAARHEPRAVIKVANAPLPAGVQAAEIWPVGDVAYVSTIAGTVYAFDITDPAAPKLTDSLLLDARLVNDVSTTADGRVGVLSREGASTRKNGLVFFDASDPRHPKVLSEFSEGMTGGVHSAFVSGRHVYATDDATGSLRIIDFTDPRHPRQVGRWEVPRPTSGPYEVAFLNIVPERYLHDVHVRDGLAYLAYWRDGLIILDVGKGIKGGSVTNPQLVSRLTYNHADLYPAGYIAGTHAVFAHGRYVFLADESYSGTLDLSTRDRFETRGRLHVVDASDPEHPRKVAEWDPGEFGVHNLWAEDDLLYAGAYDGGLRVVDIAGELRGDLGRQGRVFGHLYTGALTGFRPNMALTWGVVPHRGHLFATDINTGLWIAKVTGGTATP